MIISDGKHIPETVLTRRAFATAVLALPLVACQDSDVVSVRFRVIATVEYKGQAYEASTVMECRYWRVKGSLTGRGGGTKLLGEALIFDLPEGAGTFYILPCWRDNTGVLNSIYEEGLLTTFGITTSIGSLREQDLMLLSKTSGRFKFEYNNHLPLMVSFADQKQPKTIFQINPFGLEFNFPGFRFSGFSIEVTDEPVTQRIRNRLEWLKTPKTTAVFDRYPAGQQKPYSERPIGFLILKSDFFGNGSV